jgi:hypothetical protein
MKNASHISCIGCHREMSGPVNCSECHNKSGEEKTASSGHLPMRNHVKPDITNEREKNSVKERERAC